MVELSHPVRPKPPVIIVIESPNNTASHLMKIAQFLWPNGDHSNVVPLYVHVTNSVMYDPFTTWKLTQHCQGPCRSNHPLPSPQFFSQRTFDFLYITYPSQTMKCYKNMTFATFLMHFQHFHLSPFFISQTSLILSRIVFLRLITAKTRILCCINRRKQGVVPWGRTGWRNTGLPPRPLLSCVPTNSSRSSSDTGECRYVITSPCEWNKKAMSNSIVRLVCCFVNQSYHKTPLCGLCKVVTRSVCGW